MEQPRLTRRQAFWRALGAQFGIGLSVSVLHTVLVLLNALGITLPPNEAPFMAVLGTPFAMGGYTVRWVFERFVAPLEWLVGHRSATVLSNLSFYGTLWLIQATIVTILLVVAFRHNRSWQSKGVLALCTLLVANGLANLHWPWWGT